jgi:hypothetical protein
MRILQEVAIVAVFALIVAPTPVRGQQLTIPQIVERNRPWGADLRDLSSLFFSRPAVSLTG